MSNHIIIRRGNRQDIPILLDIYNYEVVHGVATLDIHPRTIEEWTKWYEAHNIKNHPLLVALVNDHVAGYATLSEYRTKEAFASTVELSIYVAPQYRGIGVANQLMADILTMAKEDTTIHLVVSVITAGNEASVALHNKYNFTFCGTIREVGVKHGQYLDIENYTLLV
ncbi:GNAT family N-acetyltransferase [Veillonella criceti]|uniref:N-acyltransferase YncA n=1 Tax=Veillonella criceti TaxID=103891 RepID=A0A380NKH9_9FIRM|nr:GNAT family N-acetyltransferase [Veillonella criceti]SUP43214.1 N-acyltransferase YncA [Veillonella criceti]